MLIFLHCAIAAEEMGISQVLDSINRLNTHLLVIFSHRGTVTLKEMDAAPGSVSQVSARMQFHVTGRWLAAVACCIPSQHCDLLPVELLVLI